MKKIIIALIFCSSLSVNALAGATKVGQCANGKGELWLDNDGITTYCRSSKISMNWWSAVAWCEAIGGRLIDINKDCSNTGCEKYGFIGAYTIWTSNSKDDANAFQYGGWSGIKAAAKTQASGGNLHTFCIMN